MITRAARDCKRARLLFCSHRATESGGIVRVGMHTKHASVSGGCFSGLFMLAVLGLAGYAVVVFWVAVVLAVAAAGVVTLLVLGMIALVRRLRRPPKATA
jgi:hypothetical protein